MNETFEKVWLLGIFLAFMFTCFFDGKWIIAIIVLLGIAFIKIR